MMMMLTMLMLLSSQTHPRLVLPVGHSRRGRLSPGLSASHEARGLSWYTGLAHIAPPPPPPPHPPHLPHLLHPQLALPSLRIHELSLALALALDLVLCSFLWSLSTCPNCLLSSSVLALALVPVLVLDLVPVLCLHLDERRLSTSSRHRGSVLRWLWSRETTEQQLPLLSTSTSTTAMLMAVAVVLCT